MRRRFTAWRAKWEPTNERTKKHQTSILIGSFADSIIVLGRSFLVFEVEEFCRPVGLIRRIVVRGWLTPASFVGRFVHPVCIPFF